jgi:MFS family permease
MGNFCITGLAPGYGQIFDEFHCSTSQLSYLISGPGLGEALGCFFIAPLASRYGKRPLWVVCSTLFFICNICAAVSPNYSSLLVGRIFAAWACKQHFYRLIWLVRLLTLFLAGTSEPLCVDTINDLFFLHERGTQTGVQGLWLCFGATLAPVAGGFLIAAKGWRWFHWVLAIFTGVNALLIFLFVPETQCRRDLHKSLDVTMAEDSENVTEVADFNGKSDVTETEGGLVREQTTTNQSATQSVYVKRTFWQDLKPWSGVRKDVSLFGAFTRPWALFSYVSVIWNVMAFSIHISW